MNEQEVLKLYNALIGRGYTTDELGDEQRFVSKMADANNRKQLYDWVSSNGDFRIGDYDSYETRLTGAKQESQPQSEEDFTMRESKLEGNERTEKRTVQPIGNIPSVQQMMDEHRERTKMQPVWKKEEEPINPPKIPGALDDYREETDKSMQQMQRNVERMGEFTEQRGKYAQKQAENPLPADVQRVEPGNTENVFYRENPGVVEDKKFNPETGKWETTYLNEYGEYPNRALAEADQNPRDAERKKYVKETFLSLGEKIEKTKSDIEDIDKQLEKLGWGKLENVYYEGYTEAADTQNRGEKSKKINQLLAAKRDAEERLHILEESRDKEKSGFWRNLWHVTTNPLTWTFGLVNISDWVTKTNAKSDAEDKSPLTDEEQVLLQNMVTTQEARQMYGDDMGAMARYGTIAGEALPFIVEFLLTGGFSGVGKAVSGRVTNFLAKKTSTNLANKGLRSWLVKSTGTVAGDVTRGAIMANTTGLAKTAADAAERHFGVVISDGKGGYRFGHYEKDENGEPVFVDGGKSWARSIYEAEAANTIEYYTEMLGTHIDKQLGRFGSWIMGKKASKKATAYMLKKLGLAEVSNDLMNVTANAYGNAVEHVLKKANINSIPGEILEEEANIGLNALAVGDNSLSDYIDERTQADIIGGMIFSVGFMQSLPAGYGTYKAAGYLRAKKKMDESDKEAAYRLTEDVWGDLRERIDNTTNDKVAYWFVDIKNDNSLTQEQKVAAMDYVRDLIAFRGFNIGTAAQAKDIAANAEYGSNGSWVGSYDYGTNTSYVGGYNAGKDQLNDIKNGLDYMRQQVTEAFSEEDAELLEQTPITRLYSIVNGSAYSDYEKNLAVDFVNAKATYDGMIQKVRDDIDGRISESDRLISERTSKTDGMIHPAKLKVDDRQVYIVGGQVVLSEDGSIDRDKSLEANGGDGMLLIRDENTGKIETADIGDFLSVDAPIDAEEERRTAQETIRQQYAQQAADEIEGVLPFNDNDVYNVLDEEGQEHTIQVVPAGDAASQMPTDNGQVLVSVDGAYVPQVMTREEVQKMADAYNLARLAKHEQEKAEAQAEQAEETLLNGQEGSEGSAAEPQPTEQAADENAMPMVEVNGKMKPDFDTATPERAHQYIYNERGLTREEADAFVNANIDAIDKEIKKQENGAPKFGTGKNEYTDIDDFSEAKAAWQANMDALNARKKYWQGVKDAQQRILSAELDARAAEDAANIAQAQQEEQLRQEEELRKQAEQAALGTNNVASAIREKWDAAQKIEGARNEIVLANGERVPGRYVLVESGAATPSHNAMAEFVKNEGFPVDENGQSVNDRDYERDKDAQAITRQIADNYDQRALQSPVVVTNDGVVLSGNGRTMAGELAAAHNTDGAYIEHLKNYGQQFGFTSEQVSSMQHPRVVFVPDAAMPYTADTFAKFNQQEMKGQSKTEQAVKLGKIVDDATFGRIIRSINKFDTLGDFYNDAKAATEAINELRKAGAISEAQYAEMFDGDAVSAQGREILENMLIGKAFESNPDAVREITAIKSMKQSIITALAEISNNIALKDYSLESELAQAIALVYDARKNGGFKFGEKVSTFARQGNLFTFDEGATVADYNNATVMMLADVINDNRVTRLKKWLSIYNGAAVESANGQLDLFTGDVKSKQDIINEVNRLLNYGTEEEQQAAIQKGRTGVQENDAGNVGNEGNGVEAEGQNEEVALTTQQTELKPVGHGAFGDIYDQFKGKAKEAIDFLIKKRSGEAIGALHHKDIGDIDLVWGEEGTGRSDGYGLAKLVKYHPDVLENLQEILDDMHVTTRSDNRVNLESDTHQAAVRLTWDNQKKTWLLTAFEKKNSALGNTTDTGETSSGGKRNDTATPQSTVSEGKGTEKSDTMQENGEENAGKEPNAEAGNEPTIENVKKRVKFRTKEQEEEFDRICAENSSVIDAVLSYFNGLADRSEERMDKALTEYVGKKYPYIVNHNVLQTINLFEEEATALANDTEIEELRSKMLDIFKDAEETSIDLDNILEGVNNNITADDVAKVLQQTIDLDKGVRDREESLFKPAQAESQEQPAEENAEADASETVAGGETAIEKQVQEFVDAYKKWGKDVHNDASYKAYKDAQNRLHEQMRAMSDDELAAFNEKYGKQYGAIADEVLKEQGRRLNEARINKSFEDGLQAQGEITGTAKAPKVATDSFTAKDEQRPVLNGVYHDESGYAVATDGRLLVADKSQYDEGNKGKIVASHNVGEYKKGDVIPGNYPKWRMVVDGIEGSNTASVTWDSLRNFLAGVEDTLKSRWKAEKESNGTKESFASWSEPAIVAIRMPNGEVCVYNYDMLRAFADAAASMGMSEITYGAENPLKATNDNGVVMVMPVNPEGIRMSDGRRVFYEWNDAKEQVEQTTEQGNVVLFQKVDGSTLAKEANAVEEAMRDEITRLMRAAGIEVITDWKEGQRVLDAYKELARMMSAGQKRILETAPLTQKGGSMADISSIDGAKVLKNLETLAEKLEKVSSERKNFLSEVGEALNAEQYGSSSRYATFKTKNDHVVTIRLANHNATVSGFDYSGRNNGISIVISKRANEGVNNNGDAHLVEFFYSDKKINKADGKPLAAIVRSIQQALYSGEYKDTTGLAEREEVNADIQFFRTKDGEAYGFTLGGKIYLDPRIATSETPIHEYAHLWSEALEKANPKAWQQLKDELANDKELLDFVKGLYPDIKDENELMHEVFSNFAGRQGRERLEQMRQEEMTKAQGILSKARIAAMFKRLADLLDKYWNMARDLFAGKIDGLQNMKAEDFADMMMNDLMSGFKPESGGKNATEMQAGKINYQFVGEQGAAEADRAEGSVTRIENLATAKQMEADGKPAINIKMATGWERGKDGKWRYETQDELEVADKGIDAVLDKARKEVRDLEAKADALLESANRIDASIPKRLTDKYSEEEKAKYEKMREERGRLLDEWHKANRAFREKEDALRIDGISTTLGEILGEDYELFKYYPEMKSMPVVMNERLDAGGEYEDGKIRLRTRYGMASTLLHEIQHAIQEKEGFARGGNLRSAIDDMEVRDAFIDELRKDMGDVESSLDMVRDAKASEEAVTRYAEERGISEDDARAYFDSEEARLELKRREYNHLFDMLNNDNMPRSTAFEYYRRIAGEVEARNVQARAGMTPEERRRSLAEETEDILRGEQIVTYGDAGGSASSEDRLHRQPTFYSNAERAVEGIKQEKATPEQWLAMITKAGGSKAGEDKWLGLSEWLKDAATKGQRTLTKQEVLDYIRENQVQVEEVNYGMSQSEEWQILDAFNEEFYELQDEAYNNNPDIDVDEQIRYAWDKMCERYGASGLHGFNNAFRVDINGRLEIDNIEEAIKVANEKKGMNISKPINSTRLDYTTEGLENKREIALVVPSIESWNEGDEIHFGDAGNGRAVAWVRFGETKDAQGKRVLVIDEIQSKRHQEGREKGYADKNVKARYSETLEAFQNYQKEQRRKYGENTIPAQWPKEARDEFDRLRDENNAAYDELLKHKNNVPDAPFDKNWHELAMKRMLRYAAENGYDKIAWTKGEQQAERYDLSKAVEKIDIQTVKRDGKDVKMVNLKFPERGQSAMYVSEDGIISQANGLMENANGKHVSEVFGKSLAEKIMNTEWETIDGDGLRIGGEGMAGFYDQILPRFMDKYGKKWGVKTGEVDLPEIGQKMHAVDVTPEMKESVMEGQPMFREGGYVPSYEESLAMSKAAGYTKKQHDAWWKRTQRNMRSDAEDAVKKLHLEGIVDIYDDADGLNGLSGVTDEDRKSKGWFDKRTGKIVVILGNHGSAHDVLQTIMHEGVAHYGLRKLFGKHFDTFLDNVYAYATPEVRREIVELAKNRGWDFRTATEEYLASLAEDTNFEKPEVHNWWQTIKDLFFDMLHKIGLKSFGSEIESRWGKVEFFNDNELRYLLWRSYRNLTEPGLWRSIVDEAEDIAKQYNLGVGRYAKKENGLNGQNRQDELQKAAEAETTPGINLNEIESIKAEPENDGFVRGVGIHMTMTDGQTYHLWVETDEENGDEEYLGTTEFYGNEDDSIPDEEMTKRFGKFFGENVNTIFGSKLGSLLTSQRTQRNGITLDKNDIAAYTGKGTGSSGENDDVMQKVIDAFKKKYPDESTIALVLKGDRYYPSDSKAFVDIAGQASIPKSKLDLYLPRLVRAGKRVAIIDYPAPFAKAAESDKLHRDGDETKGIWADKTLGLQEQMTETAARLANENSEDKVLRGEAMRAIGANLSDLRKAMSLQRHYDRLTVKRVADLSRILIDGGYLNDLSKQEVKRLLSALKNSTGKEEIDSSVQKVMDIMVDNQLKHAEETLHQLETIKGSKVDARGVEVQGELDPTGQQIIKVFKKMRGEDKEDINNALSEAQERMGSEDAAIAETAALEYAGLQFALEYAENIKASKAEERELRQELENRHEETSHEYHLTDEYKEYKQSVEDAIRQNKAERVEAYYDLVSRLSGNMRESMANAAAFKEAEKQRVREIQHNANSDMEGRPSNEHYKPKFLDKFVNNPFVRFFFAPLATFDQFLRLLGSKSANGEGYLYNRFMRGWVDAKHKEIRGVRSKYAALDAKANELFGGKVKTWGDIIRKVGKMPKASVSFWDGGEMREHELTQGNLLYIYMVNKMLDGRMKLRKMGITEEDVENIERVLDPRLIKLAEWMQEEFLVETRNEYNETHKRMFGASMAAVEHYFPLKILANARADKPEDLDNPERNEGISTATGSIIKRRRNALALDITGADALNVILDHVAKMEHWNAFAEFNRDLNTLRTYKRFRNQVQNMTSVYGSGTKLWEKFNDLCQMAAGTYRPKRATLDEAAVNLAKGVTAAKVSFRLFTALKQLLSAPAYISEARPDYLVKNIAMPWKAWSWGMEHLPIFEERWKSRIAGDPRLMKTELDWAGWRNNVVQIASRIGMSPNAFIDALTVSIGARAIYETKKSLYLDYGYSEEQAEKKAIQDAEIAYNQTQQSSEGAFLSTMQVDRSWLTVLFTIFRNSSMAYQRQLHDAIRNIKRDLTPGQREKSIAFMAKQFVRDGIDEEQAIKNAESRFNRQIGKDAVRVAVFGFVMQLCWNMGSYLPYLLFGDDDDEKDKMWDDILAKTYFGSIEGFTGGDVLSQAGQMLVIGEGNPTWLVKDMPLTGEIQEVLKKLGGGKTSEAITDIVNLVVQAGIGVNPQSITDAVLAVMDVCNGDAHLAHEATIFAARIMQVPQSQIDKLYFDDVKLSGKEAKGMTFDQLVKRYAEYKVKRENFFSPWAWDDEERLEKKSEKAYEQIKERLENMSDEDADNAMERNYLGDGAGVSEATRKAIGSAKAKRLGGTDYYYQHRNDSEHAKAYAMYRDYFDMAGDVLLQAALKEANEAKDEKRAYGIESARKDMNGWKPLLVDGKHDPHEVMEKIRVIRNEALEKYGKK